MKLILLFCNVCVMMWLWYVGAAYIKCCVTQTVYQLGHVCWDVDTFCVFTLPRVAGGHQGDCHQRQPRCRLQASNCYCECREIPHHLLCHEFFG